MSISERSYSEELNLNEDLSISGATDVENAEANKSQNQQRKQEIGANETKLVNYSKTLLLLVIFLVALLIGGITFYYVRREEAQDYHTQFENIANEIIQFSDLRAHSIFDSLFSVSADMTSYALAVNATWPFVRVPNYQIKAALSNQVTGAETLDLVPIVSYQDREKWEEFSVANQDWIAEGHEYNRIAHPELYQDPHETSFNASNGIFPYIHRFNEYFQRIPEEEPESDTPFFAPLWQRGPAPDLPSTNLNIRRFSDFDTFFKGLLIHDQPVLSAVSDATYLLVNYNGRYTSDDTAKPHSYLFQPVYDNFLGTRRIVAVLAAFLRWDNFFLNLLPESQSGIYMVLEGTCNQTFTYIINGPKTEYVGLGDLHDTDYDDMEEVFQFASFASLESTKDETYCEYSASLYPSQEWADDFFSAAPYIYAIGVMGCFLITCLFFLFYDILVQRRQKKVLESAAKTDAIVSSLFPSNVRDRLIDELGEQEEEEQQRQMQKKKRVEAFKSENVQNKDETGNLMIPKNTAVATSESIFGSKPIADLFPNTTIMFADMVGFTAWASVRDPTQVFTLLETVYHSFDQIGKRMKHVFKVETIGDCYVAVSGLPEPRDNDHAIIMTKFSVSCLHKMHQTVKDLELTLGPGTAELNLRIGLHSGPVTAGVLRGDKGRFQLFGDTMNTASRIETTGQPGRIQISEETATMLVKQGGEAKQKWIVPREEKVMAKGKGELQTYWINATPNSIISKRSRKSGKSSTSHFSNNNNGNFKLGLIGEKTSSDLQGGDSDGGTYEGNNSSTSSNNNPKNSDDDVDDRSLNNSSISGASTAISSSEDLANEKQQRLIDWNVEMLAGMLQQIVARRAGGSRRNKDESDNRIKNKLWTNRPTNTTDTTSSTSFKVATSSKSFSLFDDCSMGVCVLDEVKDTITLPKLDLQAMKNQFDPDSMTLSPEVMYQLTAYVTAIADLYMKHPFHNFEHASHVSMSVSKLLSRIVNPIEVSTRQSNDDKIATERHEHTFGLSSDPLTHFACVFSALIHDLDHPGVPNTTLVQEQTPLAKKYNDQSVAEQHSVVTAWELLMSPQYGALRNCIYSNEEEFRRFRQLVVNIVMATDIMDKDLGALRKSRWDTAFSTSNDGNSNDTVNAQVRLNCRATIVLEHLIQASDVAHTMQHWHVYRKWNERLFQEMYNAYKAGRMDKDPSEFWYQGEIGFFDHYIIPLAKKLDTCGVFGVSSDEYLTYAQHNRREWEKKGKSLVQEYLLHCQRLEEKEHDDEQQGQQ